MSGDDAKVGSVVWFGFGMLTDWKTGKTLSDRPEPGLQVARLHRDAGNVASRQHLYPR